MRNAMLAMVALMSAGAATIAGPTPAAAIDYPYCIQGGGWGVPGDCSYPSYAACMAAASGRRVYSNINLALHLASSAAHGTIDISKPIAASPTRGWRLMAGTG